LTKGIIDKSYPKNTKGQLIRNEKNTLKRQLKRNGGSIWQNFRQNFELIMN